MAHLHVNHMTKSRECSEDHFVKTTSVIVCCLTHVVDRLVGVVEVGAMACSEKYLILIIIVITMLEMITMTTIVAPVDTNLLTIRKQKRTMKVMERKIAP